MPEDLWDGDLDDAGMVVDRDDVYGDDTAPHVASTMPADMTAQEAIAARYRLPEEFWGSRDLFKAIRQSAWASQTHPDAVLACVLTRAAGAAGHEVAFNTGKSLGTMSLFAVLLSKSGIGKSDAVKAAKRFMQLPGHLLEPEGGTNMDVFRDGLSLSTGEGLAETYMGSVDVEATNPDGSPKFEMKGRGRNSVAEPVMVKVRKAVRHRAWFYVDEGEVLTKLMHERSGATLGGHMRTAWSGAALSQSNASEERWRYVPDGSYTIGMIIGYQPETAVAMLSEVGPGTPQRFLWFGAQDTEMPDPDEEFEFPESVTIPPEDLRTGVIEFPRELRRWFRHQIAGKHHGTIEFDPMDSHEPLMRAKLSALLCWLDGRMLVNRDDWILAGMIWSVSCAIRDRLIRHRDAEAERQATAKREERLAEAVEVEVMRVSVSADVERVAKRILRKVMVADDAFESVKAYRIKKDFGRDKPFFDVALTHAKRMDWITQEEGSGDLRPGASRPSE
jgi:hypothetical protein